ncbi:hypothetical protein YPPY10_1272, partial [Yersinia pestis PY-10]
MSSTECTFSVFS